MRTALTALVIVHHTAITFGTDGSWFFRDPAAPFSLPLTVLTAVDQSFFMGLFFGVAGYFSGPSLARKGPLQFLADRGVRLGVPALFFGWVLYPLIVWLQTAHAHQPFVWPPLHDFNPGPLWFTLALLLFCVVLVVVRQLRPAGEPSTAPLRFSQAIRLALAMAVLTVATRLVFPLGVNVLWFQVGYFPQYILLFCVGVASGGTDFLARVPGTWLLPALLAGATGISGDLAVFLLGAGGNAELMWGGMHWQAATYAVLECVQCVAFCVVALLLAREHAGRSRLGGGTQQERLWGLRAARAHLGRARDVGVAPAARAGRKVRPHRSSCHPGKLYRRRRTPPAPTRARNFLSRFVRNRNETVARCAF